ncbi:hypothetical protein V8C86DRAFT_2435663 [Haematococcus lacustris]
MANPVIPTPDTQDPHPPAEAEGWTQKYKNNTVSVLDLYNQLKQSNALRDTYRLKLDVTRKVVLLVCLLCSSSPRCLATAARFAMPWNCAQMTKYNKIQAVATHCASRFAILYLICVDLKRSQDALVMMVHSGEWETLRTASTNAALFEELKSRSYDICLQGPAARLQGPTTHDYRVLPHGYRVLRRLFTGSCRTATGSYDGPMAQVYRVLPHGYRVLRHTVAGFCRTATGSCDTLLQGPAARLQGPATHVYRVLPHGYRVLRLTATGSCRTATGSCD